MANMEKSELLASQHILTTSLHSHLEEMRALDSECRRSSSFVMTKKYGSVQRSDTVML